MVVARDVVFDESLPASQPVILTSEPAILDQIRVLPVPTFSASSPTPSNDSAAVTTTIATINNDTNEPVEEDYIPSASAVVDNSDIIEGPRRGKGQPAPRYDQIDWSKLWGRGDYGGMEGSWIRKYH